MVYVLTILEKEGGIVGTITVLKILDSTYLHTLLSSVGVGTYPFFQKPFFCPVNVLIPAYVACGITQNNGRSFSNATTPSTF
jgi:hypothetical protein